MSDEINEKLEKEVFFNKMPHSGKSKTIAGIQPKESSKEQPQL